MKKRNKRIILIIVSLVLIAFLWNHFDNQTLLKATVVKAYIFKIDKDYLSMIRENPHAWELSEEQLETILQHKEEFVLLLYDFEFTNSSSWKKIEDVIILPKFPVPMSRFVYAYVKKSQDGTAFPIEMAPNGRRSDFKSIILRKKYIDNELLKLISKVEFSCSGDVVIDISFESSLILGYCSDYAVYSKSFKVIPNADHTGPIEGYTEKFEGENR